MTKLNACYHKYTKINIPQEVTLPQFCALAIFFLVIQEVYLEKFCTHFMPSPVNYMHMHGWWWRIPPLFVSVVDFRLDWHSICHDLSENYFPLLHSWLVASSICQGVCVWYFEVFMEVKMQSTLKLVITCSSEMLVTTYHSAWFHNLEDENTRAYLLHFIIYRLTGTQFPHALLNSSSLWTIIWTELILICGWQEGYLKSFFSFPVLDVLFLQYC